MAHSPDDAAPHLSPEAWGRIQQILTAALEHKPAERAGFLKRACAGDEELYREVQSLLACEGQQNQLLESVPWWQAAGLFLTTQFEGSRPKNLLDGADSLAGIQVDRFRITRCLGRGGMGAVYSAEDSSLGRTVALKFLAVEAPHREAIEQVTREARAASALNHPNIVTVHEVIRHGDTPVIVMELIEGMSLRTLCHTAQPIERVLQLGRQIAEALAAAHAHGIVHSDIKPENILVRPDGYVKLLDFGLARPVGDGAGTPDALQGGTLRYMSPGQARGEPATPASDIFSFGLVLYELATGQHAFPNYSPVSALYAMLKSEPALQPLERSVTPRLRSLILSMLAMDPALRPSAQEVVDRLNIFLQPVKPTWRQPYFWTAMLAVFLLTLAGMGWYRSLRRDAPQYANLSIEPLTSQAGWEGAPALSPDGQWVAFTWCEKLDRSPQLYLKKFNGSEPVQLTHSREGGNIGPMAWSPDGGKIAFERQAGDAIAIYEIASSGSGERKILDLRGANTSSAIDWSPDGSEIAFAEQETGSSRLAVCLFNLKTGQTRQLTSAPAGDWGDWDPKFSPDGVTIAFKRVTSFWTDDIYLVQTAGGPPRRLTTNQRGIWGHAWVPDGKSLILSCQRGSTLFGLWRFPLRAPSQPERITQGGTDAVTPTTARNAHRLAWVNQLWDLNIYRAPLVGSSTPIRLIASTVRDQGPAYAPDGRIAFISDRSGSREIWLAGSDGSHQIQLTHFSGPPLGNLAWSPDGRQIAFDSRLHGYSDIFAIDCGTTVLACGKPRPLTREASAEAPSWSTDGKLIYFAMNRGGPWNIWRQSTRGGPATQVTRDGGYVSHESSDGKWLYYSKAGREGIWRRRTSETASGTDQTEERVIGPPYRVQREGWGLTGNEIVFVDLARGEDPPAIRAYNVLTHRARTVLALSEVFSDRGDIGVSISPDGRWILYSQLDRSGSNVIVAENSR